MNRKDLDSLNELYLSVYDGEQLDEAPQPAPEPKLTGLQKDILDIRQMRSNSLNRQGDIPAAQKLQTNVDVARASRKMPPNSSPAPAPARNGFGASTAPMAAKSSVSSATAPATPPRPASGNVVSTKNIAGQQQKVTVGRQYAATLGGNKGTVSYDASGKRTFNKTPDAPMRKEPLWDSGTPKPSSPTPAASAPKPAIGKLGNTSFERRTPTSAELRAAQTARAGGASPEKALQAAQKTNLPTTGPTPAIPDLKSVSADLARANTPANLNRAPAGSAAAKALAVKPATSTPTPSQIAGASQGIKPATPGQNSINNTNSQKKEMVKSSYEWPSAKTIRDIAGAYASIYEAKKKVDQDQDGDNDFADVRVARMIASGVPKAKAIAMVKDKSYNEEVELWVNDLLEEGYDLSDYTWDEMAEIYLDEGIGSAIRGLFSKKKEDETPKPQSRGDQLRARYNVGPEKSDTSAKRKILNRAKGNAERAQTQVDMGNASQSYADKAKEAHNSYLKAGYSKYGADLPPTGRGNKARKRAAAMTPREIKEAYAAYEFVASYLLENNFASTVNDANVIINNMSEGWFESIMEEKKPLPVAKMKRKESKLLDNEEGQLQALRTDVGSNERKARMKELQRFDNINSVRTSVAKRGGKQQHSMPEIGRFKPKDED
jgi:hypothetical protein